MEPRVGTSVLPYETMNKFFFLAKCAIDNCTAGRAAKGANPLLCAKQKKEGFCLPFFVLGYRTN